MVLFAGLQDQVEGPRKWKTTLDTSSVMRSVQSPPCSAASLLWGDRSADRRAESSQECYAETGASPVSGAAATPSVPAAAFLPAAVAVRSAVGAICVSTYFIQFATPRPAAVARIERVQGHELLASLPYTPGSNGMARKIDSRRECRQHALHIGDCGRPRCKQHAKVTGFMTNSVQSSHHSSKYLHNIRRGMSCDSPKWTLAQGTSPQPCADMNRGLLLRRLIRLDTGH